jgi:hypothetical protein
MDSSKFKDLSEHVFDYCPLVLELRKLVVDLEKIVELRLHCNYLKKGNL